MSHKQVITDLMGIQGWEVEPSGSKYAVLRRALLWVAGGRDAEGREKRTDLV
jgi:hypothetical protein